MVSRRRQPPILGGYFHHAETVQPQNSFDEIFSQAKLTKPAEGGYQSSGGINGMHTEHLGYILAEMQFLPRAYPDAIW